MKTFVLNFSGKCKLLAIFIMLCFLNAAVAQGPVVGYDFLGSCSGHNYYITQGYFFGNQISGRVADFQSKTAVPDNHVYAAAIANAAENECITNLMLAYNASKYGGQAKAPGAGWNDIRNAWIGFTDVNNEGNFAWSNGQPNCNNYRNWNIDEPNNHGGNVSNGEDYTQILIMEPYLYHGQPINPLGKWNDWYNQNIILPNGQDLGPTPLPVIIEVGPADCPTDRDNYGCSHGYWKNAATKAWTDAGYARTDIISTEFGITNGRNVITLGGTTLDAGLDLNGGGYNQVAKQGIAALLNAGQGFYPYTTAEIITAVRSMFNTGSATLPAINVAGKTYSGGNFNSPNALASYLEMLNNLGCPLNNHGYPEGQGGGGPKNDKRTMAVNVDAKQVVAGNQFMVDVLQNPSNGAFNLRLSGSSAEKISIRVMDAQGRIMEQRQNVPFEQVLRLGSDYQSGIYVAEIMQGSTRRQVKLVKGK
ncbi:T9SS type A sorting domain-containing protein [Segetibacter sp. 3557_3]|uniref:T9SS type A sorting domain-containing protein n=1 Tax=Segetibacter sp. 3557_3 TaxID=2547429 RepID=UPI0010583C09|nr:T9SS type A sorting domain-containing protein [Segetibacter sp. 3557_3]TDH29192.1 T9SS type A sorting domain-containing protein [Segetibacter sp. 3557_3]